MTKMIFVSLPVADLARARAFYEAVGFSNDARFSDDSGAAMVWSDAIYVMLSTREKWATFTDRPLPPAGSSEVSLSLAFESRAAVDRFAETAGRVGGTVDVNPVQDHGFMYARDVTDPDDHVWGGVWMDPAVAEGDGPPPA